MFYSVSWVKKTKTVYGKKKSLRNALCAYWDHGIDLGIGVNGWKNSNPFFGGMWMVSLGDVN